MSSWSFVFRTGCCEFHIVRTHQLHRFAVCATRFVEPYHWIHAIKSYVLCCGGAQHSHKRHLHCTNRFVSYLIYRKLSIRKLSNRKLSSFLSFTFYPIIFDFIFFFSYFEAGFKLTEPFPSQWPFERGWGQTSYSFVGIYASFSISNFAVHVNCVVRHAEIWVHPIPA